MNAASTVHVRLRVGAETYALPVESVTEVAEIGTLTTVPGAGTAVLGVRNLHGQVLPVFDLSRILGIVREGHAPRIVVAESGGRRAGLAVDEVTDVSPLPAAEHEAAELEYLSSSVLEDGRLVGVIDVSRIFETFAREAS